MSQETKNNSEQGVELNALYAFKEGMSTVFGDSGEALPVTLLRFEKTTVTQVKTEAADGYQAVQVSFSPEKLKNSTKAALGHFKKAGSDVALKYSREVRQPSEGVVLGADVSIDSLKKGNYVNITGVSKGKGFAGSVRRWGFAGGPATHGSKFHRRPGSSGNRTWPGRVMPGKKFPGHYGVETVTVKNVLVVDVLKDDGVILLKGPVPGAKNSLVKLVRV